MRFTRFACASVIAMATAACSGGRGDLCRRRVELACEEFFRCTPDAGAERFGDRKGCESQGADWVRCWVYDELSCPGENLGPSWECLEQNARTPICGDVRVGRCQPPDLPVEGCSTREGTPLCVSSLSDDFATPARCTFSQTGCTDGHRYYSECRGDTCWCHVDGVETRTTPFGSCDVSAVNARCGWSLR